MKFEALMSINYDVKNAGNNKKEINNVLALSMSMSYHKENNHKFSTLNSWTAHIEGHTFTSDNLEDFETFLYELLVSATNTPTIFGEDATKYAMATAYTTYGLHIYTHNLKEDFQTLRNIFNDAFITGTTTARGVHDPIAQTFRFLNANITLHDTLSLVPKSLKDWNNDANLNSTTDTEIIAKGIEQYKAKYETLKNIPYTQAGEVRRECKNAVRNNAEWMQQCEETTRSYTAPQYEELVKLFIGGSIYANPQFTNIPLNNIRRFDLGSAYISKLTTKPFPVTPWEITDKETEGYIHYYKMEYTNVKPKLNNRFWPESRCEEDSEGVHATGAYVDSADKIVAYMTDVDKDIFESVYSFSGSKTIFIKRSKAGYIPKALINAMLNHYRAKTAYKNDDSNRSKYIEEKTKVNQFFGVFVTKTLRDEIVFNKTGWEVLPLTEENFNDKLKEIIEGKPFTTYQIGVWVTAYCRQAIWSIIPMLDQKIVYFDTDCIAGFFNNDDIDLFNNYNDNQIKENEASAERNGISAKRFSPKTKAGTTKPLGLFEEEDTFKTLKILGSKRYAGETEKGLTFTIAGIAKPRAKAFFNSIDEFRDGVTIPADKTGNLCVEMIDNQKATYKYGTYKEAVPFTLSPNISDAEISNLIRGRKTNIYFTRTKIFRNIY